MAIRRLARNSTAFGNIPKAMELDALLFIALSTALVYPPCIGTTAVWLPTFSNKPTDTL